ncbi:hypothetical protein AB2L27_19835 [Kineococcus sp. LSe6-4]|uniref:Uncharacterized protein n=1 Tax=Kineococcus halophytocola TaxID=3234027 RepID=A0ABV4H5Z3_9ACTN
MSPSTVPVRPLLRPGTHLFPSTDGTRWFLAEPGERFTRLLGPAEVLRALQPELHTGSAAADASDAPAADVPAELREGLHAALRERGALTGTPDDAPTRPRVLLEGSGSVADAVRRLLTSFAEVTPDPAGGDTDHEVGRRVTSGATLDVTCDVRITCAGWLPDHAFDALDRWSLRAGVPWHHVHVEGTALVVGPLQTPGGVRYRDWRGRRLAASTTPEELSAFWAYLSSGSGLPDLPPFDPGPVAVAAGLLVDDVQRWWNGWRGRPDEHVVDRGVDGTVRVERHPVLPLPIP